MDSFGEPHEAQSESFLTEANQEEVSRRGRGRRNRHNRRGKAWGEQNAGEYSSLLSQDLQESTHSTEESTVDHPSVTEVSALELPSYPPMTSSHSTPSPPPPPSPLPLLSEEMPPSPPPSFASIHAEESEAPRPAATQMEWEKKAEEPALSSTHPLAPTVLPDAPPAGEEASRHSPTTLALPHTTTTTMERKEEEVKQTIPTPSPLPHSAIAGKKAEEQTPKPDARRIRFADLPETSSTTAKVGTTGTTTTPSAIHTTPPQTDRPMPVSVNGLKREEVPSKVPSAVARRNPNERSSAFSSWWVLGIAIPIVLTLLFRVLKRR